MKQFLIFAWSLVVVQAQWINEFHYDNEQTDENEFVEIAGPAGTDLQDWRILLYNGNNGKVYDPEQELTGIIPDEVNGYGALAFFYPVNGIQNGKQDAIALIDPAGQCFEFIGYEGVLSSDNVRIGITAVNGPCAGQTAIDIQIRQNRRTAKNTSLALEGPTPAEFVWTKSTATPGSINYNQSFPRLGNDLGTPCEIDADCQDCCSTSFIRRNLRSLLYGGSAGTCVPCMTP